MSRSHVLSAACALTFLLAINQRVPAQEETREIPTAPAASAEAITRLIESGAYQYAVSIRSTSGDEAISLGRPHAAEPQYAGVAARGIESFAGIPMELDGKIDPELPCSLYYKIKVVSLEDEVARVKLTVGYASDAERTQSIATWNEQVWTAHRDIRLNITDTVEFIAPNGKDVPSFEVRYRVRKFDGKLQ